jgi:Mn2+/Fe2+ NRAMP family transporter
MNIKNLFRNMGPGVITGAADDDPSGIATYSQAGAQYGYGVLWLSVFMLPIQTAIQEAAARIGAVSGKGIAAVLKADGQHKTVYFVVTLILIANIINIGADIGAMAAAAALIVPVNLVVMTLLFTIIILLLQIFVGYRRYANLLKWTCLALLSYPITVFLINAQWLTILKATVIPHIEFSYKFFFIVTGILGTTISPYLFFWQASQEVEEHKIRVKNKSFKINKKYLSKLRWDNFLGMFFSEIATWSIIVVTAATLNAHGITTINSAADAAKALVPLVHSFPNGGYIAEVIFAVGIIGLGFLAIPVLSGSAAYSFGEMLNWKIGLNLKFKQAQGFYGIIIIATVIGLLINLIGINPIKALVYAAVINGIVAVPMIYIIAMLAKDKKIMGTYSSGKLSITLVWITFTVMAIATLGMFASFR